MDEVRRLRLEKGWSQNELAYHAKLAPSVISLIETGKRDPNATTLRKLAEALEVRIPDLFEESGTGKAQRRSSLEPSLFNGLEGERHSEATEAVFGLMERWRTRRLVEVGDPASPHFRDASAAALWIADTRDEAQDFCEWLADFIASRPKTMEGITEALHIFGVGLALDGPAELGELRLQEMADKPDDLAARRLERSTAAAQASMERLQELGKAANG